MRVPPPRHDVNVTVNSLPTLAPRGTPAPWDAFEHALGELVEVLDSGQYLIIESQDPRVGDETGPYVQLAIHETGIYAETVSNHFLGHRSQLDRVQKRRLVALGWAAPTGDPHDPDESETAGGSTNYSRDYDEPIDAPVIATDLVVALRDVYGVDDPRDLEYHAFAENPTALILIPTLGIRRANRGVPVVEHLPEAPELDDELDDEPDDVRPRIGTAGYL